MKRKFYIEVSADFKKESKEYLIDSLDIGESILSTDFYWKTTGKVFVIPNKKEFTKKEIQSGKWRMIKLKRA